MNEKQQLFEELSQLWSTFESSHQDTTKVSDAKARKALGEMKKLVTAYRKASVDSNK